MDIGKTNEAKVRVNDLAPNPDDQTDHLVLLIHGINTRALWMDEVLPSLQRAGFAVAPLSFGEFSIPRFISFPFLRRKALKRVLAGIETAYRVYRDRTGSYPQRTSVISHSFGTWVILTALSSKPNFKLSQLIVCGSVVREDYSLDPVLHQFQAPLLNEIGTRDYWPAIAESVGWGYGSIGSTGMHHPAVINRWHRGFRHSDFLKADFCDKFWVPFLRDGKTIVPADKAQGLPWWIVLIAKLPLRWLILLMFSFGLLWSLNLAIYRLGGVDVAKTVPCYWAAKDSLYYWISWHC